MNGAGEIPAPTRRVGFISPLDVIDIALWEFYRIAPADVIASAISVGLTGLDLRSSQQAIDSNLSRCVEQLARRKVEYIHLGGLPLLIHQPAGFSEEFAHRCMEEHGIPAGTALDSDVAAFRALGVDRIVAVNKWGTAENVELKALLETRGITLLGTVAEETAFASLKGDYAVGIDTARRLAAAAMEAHGDVGCLYLAGGAWLTLPIVEELEQQFGVPIVSSQVAKAWFTLHRIGVDPATAVAVYSGFGIGDQMPTIAEKLADFVVAYSFEDLSADVVGKAKLAIRDQIGCQLLGSTLPWVQAPYLMARQLGDAGPASVVRHGLRTSAPNAAMVNAVFGHSAELDDYGAGVGAHSASVCVAVAFALGEWLGKSGKDVIAALSLGYDTAWGLGEVIHKELVHRGIHAHAVQSTFSATSVAARLLDLTPLQVAHAFAIAASSAFGTMEFYWSGGEVKRFHSGKAAKAGIEAALLAKHGLTGPLTIFEGQWGIFALLAGIDGPGNQEIHLRTGVGLANNCFKFYPTLAVQQSPIRIVHDLLGQTAPDQVAGVRVSLPSGAVRDTGHFGAPTSPVAAQVSLPYSLALAVARRSNDLALYTDPLAWHADDVRSATDKIQLVAKPDARGKYDCWVEVTLSDGAVRAGGSEYPRGSHWNPASGDELEAKFRRITEGVLPQAQLDQIVAAVAALDEAADIRTVTRVLAAE